MLHTKLHTNLQDKTVRHWDSRNGSCASVIRQPYPVCAVACCPRSHRLVSGDEAGGLRFFDTRKAGVQLAYLKGLHHDTVRAIAFPPTGPHHPFPAFSTYLFLWRLLAIKQEDMSHLP